MYDFMKTGNSHPAYDAIQSNELISKVLILSECMCRTQAMVDEAWDISLAYCKHKGFDAVMCPISLIRGLKIRIINKDKFDEHYKTSEKVAENREKFVRIVVAKISQAMISSSPDIEEFVINLLPEDANPFDKFMEDSGGFNAGSLADYYEKECNCKTCKAFENSDTEFNSYEPECMADELFCSVVVDTHNKFTEMLRELDSDSECSDNSDSETPGENEDK